MGLILTRLPGMLREDGIFSTLTEPNLARVAVTVEHAYPDGTGRWCPIIPPGRYRCVRGLHRLDGMDHDFETFEITGIAGHTGLLFHWGNWNQSSKGCVCLGETLAEGDYMGKIHEQMVTNSVATFKKFMVLQAGLAEFSLEVVAP